MPGGNGGGPGGGQPGMSETQSQNISYSAVKDNTEDTTIKNETLESTGTDESERY